MEGWKIGGNIKLDYVTEIYFWEKVYSRWDFKSKVSKFIKYFKKTVWLF
jgi:hypothetical protein